MSGGMQFGMGNGDRAEPGQARHQGLFFRGKHAVRARVKQDRTLGAGGAEGRGDQHSRRYQIPQRMHLGADRQRDGLSRGDRPLRQVGCEAQGLPVVTRPGGVGQLRSLRRDRLQFKRALAAQQYTNQLGAQQNAQAIRQGLDDCRDVRRAVQGGSHVSQNFRAAMLFAGGLAALASFQQAAQLASQNRRLGGPIFGKKIVIGIMQKGDGADHFVADDQGRRQHGSGLQFRRVREGRRLQVMGASGAPLSHRFARHATLVRAHANAGEALGARAIGLLAHQFPAEVAKKVNPRDLEKIACGPAEQTNQ